MTIRKAKNSRKAGVHEIAYSEVYQLFEKKLKDKFQHLKESDLDYLKTQFKAETGKIPYPIA